LPELNVRPDFETDARLADNVNNNEDIPEATAPDSAGESADFQEIPAEDKQPSATEKLKIEKRTPEAKELPAKATNKEKPRNNSNSAGPKIEKKETGSRPLQPTRDRIVNKPPGNISEVKGKT